MKFKLEIELGNDAMQTSADIAGALIATAAYLEDGHAGVWAVPEREHGIRDINGNTVGFWWVK